MPSRKCRVVRRALLDGARACIGIVLILGINLQRSSARSARLALALPPPARAFRPDCCELPRPPDGPGINRTSSLSMPFTFQLYMRRAACVMSPNSANVLIRVFGTVRNSGRLDHSCDFELGSRGADL